MKQEVISAKYKIRGEAEDGPFMMAEVKFEIDGQELQMGIPGGSNMKKNASIVMDRFYEKARSDAPLRMRYWHLDDKDDKNLPAKVREDGTCAADGESGAKSLKFTERPIYLHGITTGHPRVWDGYDHTVRAREISIDYDAGEALVWTDDGLYHCPLNFLSFKEQEEGDTALVPEYEHIKANYSELPKPQVDEGCALLIVADFEFFWFHRAYFRYPGSKELVDCSAWPHIGTYQNSSLLINSDFTFDDNDNDMDIDIAYFPHMDNIEFYNEPNDWIFFVQNIGDSTVYLQTSDGVIELPSGSCKLVCPENAMENPPELMDGDR